MEVPDLRRFIPGKPVCVDETKMLDTEARETPETVKGTNDMKEEVVTHMPFKDLGAKGRVG